MVVAPAEAHLLKGSRLGIRSQVLGRRRPVGLAERVAADDEGDRLLVVHRHTGERLPDVARGRKRVRLAVRAFRIDVDQTHLHGRERIRELAVAAVTLVTEPRVLRTPVDVVRLPRVLSPAGKAEGLESHRLERAVPGED